MRFTSVTLGIAAISLLLLILLLVLVHDRFPARTPLPAVSTAALTIPSLLVTVPTGKLSTTITTSLKATTPQLMTAKVQTFTDREWQTLTDPKAGYSLRYPADFGFEAYKDPNKVYRTNSITFRLPNVHIPHIMSIEVEPNSDNLPIDALLKELYGQTAAAPLEIEALTQITVAGRTAYQTSILPDTSIYQRTTMPGKTSLHVLLPYTDRVYHFVLIHGGLVEAEPDAATIYFQILDTFHLVDSNTLFTVDSIAVTQTNTQDGWLTHIDEAAGYLIQYPAEFVVRSYISNREETYRKTEITFLALGIDAREHNAMSIRVDPNPQNLPLALLYEELKTDPLQSNASEHLVQITVAGMPAYQIRSSTEIRIFLPYHDKVYRFALVHAPALMESGPKAKAIFSKMLDTLQLIP